MNIPCKLLGLASLSLVLVGGTLACSGSTTSTTIDDGGILVGDGSTPGDGSTGDSSPGDGGTDLVPTGTTKAVVTSKGGFVGPGGDGSVCSPVDDTYTLDFVTKTLTWKLCRASTGSNVYGFSEGTKALSATEYTSLTGSMHGLVRATETKCGADAPSQAITFTAPSGSTTYEGDFYFCDASDPKLYVNNLGDVFTELDVLAK